MARRKTLTDDGVASSQAQVEAVRASRSRACFALYQGDAKRR